MSFWTLACFVFSRRPGFPVVSAHLLAINWTAGLCVNGLADTLVKFGAVYLLENLNEPCLYSCSGLSNKHFPVYWRCESFLKAFSTRHGVLGTFWFSQKIWSFCSKIWQNSKIFYQYKRVSYIKSIHFEEQEPMSLGSSKIAMLGRP